MEKPSLESCGSMNLSIAASVDLWSLLKGASLRRLEAGFRHNGNSDAHPLKMRLQEAYTPLTTPPTGSTLGIRSSTGQTPACHRSAKESVLLDLGSWARPD
jgi:hypothetical protein